MIIIQRESIDFRNGSVCWVEKSLKVVQRGSARMRCASILGMEETYELPEPDLLSYADVVGAAWDWAGGNWYFLDSVQEAVFLCRWKEEERMMRCRVVLSQDVSRPRGIALDPDAGFLFVTRWGSGRPRLERAQLDGLGRKELVTTDIVYPQAVAVDLPNRKVFWVDAYLDHIQQCDYEGKRRVTVVQGRAAQNLQGITVFQSAIIASSWRENAVLEIETSQAGNNTNLLVSNLARPTLVHIYHRQQQPLASHKMVQDTGTKEPKPPCSLDPCHHFCIPQPESPFYKCVCRAGFSLSDPRTGRCALIEKKELLLFGQSRPGLVRGVAPYIGADGEEAEEVMVPISRLGRPTTLDFHFASRFTYFADSKTHGIHRAHILNENIVIEDFLMEGLNKVEGVAVDWVGENLYWSDEGLQAIRVCPLARPSLAHTLPLGVLAHPRALAVDPGKGLLFWAEWSSVEEEEGRGGIHMAQMDGRNRKEVIGGLHWPSGLALDMDGELLYWCDTWVGRVERASYSGKDRTVLNSGPPLASRPYGLTLLGGSIFWTQYSSATLVRLDLGSNVTSVLRKENPQLFEVKAFAKERQPSLPSACSVMGCEEICLLSASEEARCACKDGRRVSANDYHQCEDDPTWEAPSVCGEDRFQCGNGEQRCISRSFLCDGVSDCRDGSDENEQCRGGDPCSKEHFQCEDSGACISRLWLCDRDKDCSDGSDEDPKICNSTCSHGTQFQCAITGTCIPASWECDGDPDCGEGDASDEHSGCAEISCLPTQLTCDTYKCIPAEYRCDGEQDCNDNSDEENCPQPCPLDQFFCESEQRCIPRSQVCDGNRDCFGGEDEADCDPVVVGPCERGEFTCADGTCVPSSFVCDGNRDCLDGSDESQSDCDVHCTSKERGCASGSKCIPSQYWCDGDIDCEDGSDEENCAVDLECNYPDHICDQELNRTKCLNVERLCDNVQDCKDGSDEGLLCAEDQCSSPLNQCSHACHASPGGHRQEYDLL